MIRCIPVDGSAPFEVENDCVLDRFTPRDDHVILRAARIADIGSADEWTPRFTSRPVACHLESWRERAERLEKELGELRQKIALDAMLKRRESEHG